MVKCKKKRHERYVSCYAQTHKSKQQTNLKTMTLLENHHTSCNWISLGFMERQCNKKFLQMVSNEERMQVTSAKTAFKTIVKTVKKDTS